MSKYTNKEIINDLYTCLELIERERNARDIFEVSIADMYSKKVREKINEIINKLEGNK